MIVAPKVSGAKLSDGKVMKADGQLAGSPSQIFDAVAIILSEDGCASLIRQGAAIQFVMDAFAHLKAIGANDASQPLLSRAGVEPDDGVTDLGAKFVTAASRRYYDRDQHYACSRDTIANRRAQASLSRAGFAIADVAARRFAGAGGRNGKSDFPTRCA